MSEIGDKKLEKLIFITIVFPGKPSETDALLLVESIRAFAGSQSQTPIWCFIPEIGKQLSKTVKHRLVSLNVTLIPFKVDPTLLRFPFTSEVLASALAESTAWGQTEFLVWLNTNTIFLQEPHDFLLPDRKSLGYRPVHHTLVGSRYKEPLDPFWTLIYHYCNVPTDHVFPMSTHVDGTIIRPYFNAGLLVIRPEKLLLNTWCDTFFQVYQEPSFQKFYHQDARYRIFIHQAVLSGVILSNFTPDELLELPAKYNYPLHLYAQDVTSTRPSCLEELVSFRHEGFYNDPDWFKKIPAAESLKQWLAKCART
jgi:hypothetical protein